MREICSKRKNWAFDELLRDPRYWGPKLDAAIRRLRSDSPQHYDALFLREETLRGASPLLEPLIEMGVVRAVCRDAYEATVRITFLEDTAFLSDRGVCADLDRVYAPSHYEAGYLAQRAKDTPARQMLDVCTGSGAIAVIYAKAYPRCNVVAVDINPRAVAYAQLNACMAGVEVDFRVGDLFQPVAKENFDLITAVPPFVPTPPGVPYFLHSDGGPTGLKVTKRTIREACNYLNSGVLFLLTYSLGNATCPTLLLGFLRRHGHRWASYTTKHVPTLIWLIYNPSWTENPLHAGRLLDRFRDRGAKFKRWMNRLLRCNLSHVHYLEVQLRR
jgi:methylase of polypeptide subunit release factors